MKTSLKSSRKLFFHAPDPHARKNGPPYIAYKRRSRLGLYLTYPPKQSLDQGCRPGLGQEVKAP